MKLKLGMMLKIGHQKHSILSSQDAFRLCWLHIYLLLINFFRILLSLKQMLLLCISNKVVKYKNLI